jgi:hypothetical protein
MDCRHLGSFAVRWDYLNEADAIGTGWLVCQECTSLVERFSVAGGRFRGSGRYLSAFREQIARQDTFTALRELEID